MTDENEIRALQANFAKYFDARDAARYALLFTEDVMVTMPWGQVVRGRDKMRKAVLIAPAGVGWHRAGETKINIWGDEADAVADFEALDRDGNINVGRYLDSYRRSPEGWLIASRQIIVDRKFPASGVASIDRPDPGRDG